MITFYKIIIFKTPLFPAPEPTPLEYLLFSLTLIIYFGIVIISSIIVYIRDKRLRKMVIQNKENIQLEVLIAHKIPYEKTKRTKRNNRLLVTLYYIITLLHPLLSGWFSPYSNINSNSFTLILLSCVYLFLLLMFILAQNKKKKIVLNEIDKI